MQVESRKTAWKWKLLSHVRLCDPMDCCLPGSPIHWILQARILEWVAIPFSRGSSWPRDWIHISCIASGFFATEPPERPIVREQNSGCQGLGEMGRCYSISISFRYAWWVRPEIRWTRLHLLTVLYCGTAPCAETWMGLETVIQSEVSQREKNKYCLLTHICGT